MSPRPAAHLSADDLDLFLTDSATSEALQHVSFCDACRATVQADRLLVAGLHRLPTLAPRDGFAERVMAGVTLAQPVPVVPTLPWYRRLAQNRRALATAAGAVLAMGASAAWTGANRELLDGWIQLASTQGTEWLWRSLQAGGAAIADQAWYAPLRDLVLSPVRATAVAATGLLVSAASLVALRRLTAIPSGALPGARG
jgi:hypothetical protein